jgi:hypothetical protein
MLGPDLMRKESHTEKKKQKESTVMLIRDIFWHT